VTCRRALAVDQVRLVVAIEVDLEGLAAHLLALQQFFRNVRVARCGDKGREPIKAAEKAVLDFASRRVAGPTDAPRGSKRS
jgi:hypothetical protein